MAKVLSRWRHGDGGGGRPGKEGWMAWDEARDKRVLEVRWGEFATGGKEEKQAWGLIERDCGEGEEGGLLFCRVVEGEMAVAMMQMGDAGWGCETRRGMRM